MNRQDIINLRYGVSSFIFKITKGGVRMNSTLYIRIVQNPKRRINAPDGYYVDPKTGLLLPVIH